ncbi:hypothetical protein BSLA_02f2665 [Burkholderia stabilis]|nr:hypothetical protein BSLA_02f2665 [Burkholderia stabilis]
MPARSPEIMPFSVNTLFRMVKRSQAQARFTGRRRARFHPVGSFARPVRRFGRSRRRIGQRAPSSSCLVLADASARMPANTARDT